MIEDSLVRFLCYGKACCTLCRSKNGGKQFRENLVSVLIEKIDADFACPSGYEWDAKIEPEFTSQKFVLPEGDRQSAMPVQMDENTELSKARFEICKACENATEEGHNCKLHKGCCFGRWRAQLGNKCPADPPKWNFTNA